MKSAWMNLRRHRYFVGPYSETPHITLVGPPPYYVLAEDCRPDELGRTIRVALGGSDKESVTEDDIVRLAQERTLALARLAGVKDRQTFERGARLVSFECVSADEILVTPNYRKRGYWEPAPEALWSRLLRPSDAELGLAAAEAAGRATA